MRKMPMSPKDSGMYVKKMMHEMKDEPSKFPGGRKQAIAIGLSKARRTRRRGKVR